MIGTLALSASEPLRDSMLGHPPPYSVGNIARRAARAWLGVRLRPRQAQRWGLAMRWLYGPALGVLQGSLRFLLPTSMPLRGFLLGGGVWLFERLSFPRLRVTPPPRTWSSTERQWLALQCLLFGLVTGAVPPLVQAGGPVRERPPREGGLPVAPGTPLSPP
ncbi:hypothetical protein NR798_46675 [Archangium gephyra]|uniref:hypothetical protein n=1 Tax=Archangium gephyra TaxID=48 RepID=UPI0035D46ECC